MSGRKKLEGRSPVNYITNRWKVKLGSMIIALLLFWYVQDAKTTTRVLNLRVDRPELPGNLTFASRIPSYMNVKVYGPREMMDFNVSDFRVKLTNPRPEVGENIYRATIYPELPDDLGAVYKRELDVQLDLLMHRFIPVEADLDVNLKEGLRAGYMEVNPATLQVLGPGSIVSRIRRIKTERVQIAGDVPFFNSKVLVDRLPEFVRLAENQPFDVDLSLRILPEDIDPQVNDRVKLVTDIPVRCREDVRGLKMTVIDRNTVDVLVSTDKNFSERYLRDRFSGEVICPVFLSTEENQIMPASTVFNMPVIINQRIQKDTLTILDVIPSRVSLEFEKVRSNTPYEVRQGMKEHLIR